MIFADRACRLAAHESRTTSTHSLPPGKSARTEDKGPDGGTTVITLLLGVRGVPRLNLETRGGRVSRPYARSRRP
jgi:hypothetical protein